LKTIAGGDNSLRIWPPHCSQAPGPVPLTPCITSTRRPQLWQA
jgi:hypothetical protein